MGTRLLASLAVILAGCTPSAGPATVVLDAQRTYQTILSWEATAQLGDSDFPQSQVNLWRDEVIRFAVDSVGLNGLRLELTSGIERRVDLAPSFLADATTRPQWRRTWYTPENDNVDPYSIEDSGFQFAWLDHLIENVVLPMRARLAAQGEPLFLNLNYVDFDPGSFKQLADAQEYAELLLAVFQHMQSKYGFTPDAIEVLLEPDVGQGWQPEELAAALVAAGDRLKEHGFEPMFIAPSNTSMAAAVEYFDRMVEDPRALEYLSILSYHRYRDVSPEALVEIGRRVEQYGIRSAMLEHIRSDYLDLHSDLAVGRVSMWQQFVLAWAGEEDDGAAYIRVLDVESGRPRAASAVRTAFLSHYFKSARRGAVRIGATSDNEEVAPLAFVNLDRSVAVVVKTEGSSTVEIDGLPAGEYRGGFTTDGGDSGALGPLTANGVAPVTVSMPGPGVMSLRGVPSSRLGAPSP